MNKSALAGSSPANPWCLDENGNLELQSVKQATATLRYVAQRRRAYRGVIHSGPPSSIRQDTPQETAARARPRHGAHRDPTFAALAAQVRARAAAEARAHAAAFTPGTRTVRILLESDLYLDKIRPPTDVQAKDHHQCAICTGMLSHPVSTQCGHTFCFVCIRLWLERQWTCPECVSTLTCPPHRHWNTEKALAADYPTRLDRSRLTTRMPATTEVNSITAADLRDMDDVERFLRSFEPSLHNLKQNFLDSGVKNGLDLEALHTWPRYNVEDFFANYFVPEGTRCLKKIVVDALVTRLKDKCCECGTCESLIEPACVDYKVKLK
ncbi:hypothetical protein B0H12DRAFT_1237014 [Mycena haematopus]|nr:hypothetical protein B0H12DRAFT_1237014 [Mycena haematopus]